MAKQLTADDARQSLNAHVAAKGSDLFLKYGPVGYAGLAAVLEDREFVRYPCKIAFDAARLQPGEFAHPEQNGAHPEEGFTLWVHPLYLMQLEKVPYLVYYQLVAVNYGEFASADDAETFGAAALGLLTDEYYAELCTLADLLGVDPALGSPAPDAGLAPAGAGGCGGGGGCGCGGGD